MKVKRVVQVIVCGLLVFAVTAVAHIPDAMARGFHWSG